MDNDIILLLYRIKVNIRKVEDGDRTCLEEIRNDYLQLMELVKLFLISEKEMYYGYFLLNMTFDVDFSANLIAGIKLNQYPPVFVANPLLYCKYSMKEILFIACHEIEHVVLNHPAEMVKANPSGNPDTAMRFNYACDASVNDRIIYDIKKYRQTFLVFPEGCIDSVVFAERFGLYNVRKNESYKYYFDLINDVESDDEKQLFNIYGESDKSGGNNTNNTNTDTNNNSDSNEKSADNIVTSNNYTGQDDHNWEAGTDAEAAQEMVREFVNEVADTITERGLMPEHFWTQLEKLNSPPEIRWEQVLKKYVGSIVAGYRKTRMRLNRRQPERFDLPGKMEDKTLKIVVAIDTSASVSDSMLSRIFNEIFAILGKRKFELTIIECDADVQRVYRVKKRHEVKMKVNGRGGTCFSPVIEYINNDRYFRDALMIYFTDGMGEQKIPRPLTYRNMWVIIGGEYLSVEQPYGIVLSMK